MASLRWSAEDDQFLRENAGVMSNSELVRRLNRTASAINARIVRFSLRNPGDEASKFRLITAWGETKNLSQWAKDPRSVVAIATLRLRLGRGMEPEKAISSPDQRSSPSRVGMGKRKRQSVAKSGSAMGRPRVIWDGPSTFSSNQGCDAGRGKSGRLIAAWGETKSIIEWSKDARCNAKYATVVERINVLGWSHEAAIATPTQKVTRVREVLADVDIRKIPRNSSHPLHRVLRAAYNRCYARKDRRAVKNYQERGIAICQEWLDDYRTFIDWALDNGWEPGLELDRRDESLGYSPENCRWVTNEQQRMNRRCSKLETRVDETKAA